MEDQLSQSELDKRLYRLIQLENGIRAILVSDVENIIEIADNNDEEEDIKENNIEDDETDKSDDEEEEGGDQFQGEKMASCALRINVGSFSDPPEIPGLAHFLEHMVFMGSKKFPKENAIDDFLKKRGGSNNASTDNEFTAFYIECRENYLLEGMDIFSQFFIAPLMLREAMTREREAIDSEFDLALPSDGSRAEQLLGLLAPDEHPAACFPWGNLVTLRDNVTDDALYTAVHEFRLRHYSANRMTLAVVARLSLDTLERYVRDTFPAVPNNELPPIDFSRFKGQFGTEGFHSLIWAKPVHDLCEVALSWVLPPMKEHYECRPLSYISSIIGNEGKGSLLSYLKKNVWALKCIAGNDGTDFEFNSMYSMFVLTIELTDQGLQNLEQVLLSVFSYLAMLKQNLPERRFFEEYRDITNANFRFKDEEDASRYAEQLCESLFNFRPEHTLVGNALYLDYKPEVIETVINCLRPDNVNVMMHCSNKPDDFYDEEEKWFKTKFKKLEIPKQWERSWKEATPETHFYLPAPNPYITTDFTLLESNEVDHPLYPKNVFRSETVELWYRQDLKFKRPFAVYSLYFISPLIVENPLNNVLAEVLREMLQFMLDEDFYPAAEAGYNISSNVGDFGLILEFWGYNEKLTLFCEEVLKAIRRICDTLNDATATSIFDAIKSNRHRLLYNSFIEPSNLNEIVRKSLLIKKYWTTMEKIRHLESITVEQLTQFCHKYFNETYVKVLVQGNVSQETAVNLAFKLPEILRISPLKDHPYVEVWKMNEGNELRCRLLSFNVENKNAALTNYYQSNVIQGNLRTICLLDLIMMLMNEPLFDSLRTQQQLGYDVSAETRDTFGIAGFSVTVHYQNSKFSADEVNQCIDNFLAKFATELREISEKDFEEAKINLSNLKKHVDLSLLEEVTRNFAEITSDEYRFDRLPKEVELIPTITQEEICQFFENHISIEKHKKLSVQILGHKCAASVSRDFELLPIAPDQRFIKNIHEFKKTREYYPPQPKNVFAEQES